jgi:hypothetical protein
MIVFLPGKAVSRKTWPFFYLSEFINNTKAAAACTARLIAGCTIGTNSTTTAAAAVSGSIITG